MKFSDDDERGFVVSLDLLIAIIPLTIMIGMVATDMGNIMFQIEDTVFRGSMDRVAADTMNTLLETSGTPPDWEKTGNLSLVGLAEYDKVEAKPTEGTISPTKLASVAENSSSVQNIIGDDYNFYITINTLDNTSTSVDSIGTYNSSANDVVRVDKVVLYSRLERVSELVGEIRYTGQSRNYNVPTFETSDRYNQSYDYWILFVNTGSASANSATVKINGNSIELNSSTINNPYNIDSVINTCSTAPTQFFNNTVEVNVTSSSFGNSMNFYIVQAPKDTPASSINYENVVPKQCMFILYLWPK